MPKSFEVDVNPKVLRWARTTAGVAVDEAAKSVHRAPTVITAWEQGKGKPTYAALEELATVYRRTLAALLLPEPPPDPLLPIDFRSAAGAAPNLSRTTRAVIRQALWLQGVAHELDGSLAEASRFGSLTIKVDPEDLARVERDTIGVDISTQFRWNDDHQAFRTWRSAVEHHNVLVFQFSLPVEEMRGFSLATELPPVVVVSSSDYIRARIFTLFHEYGHLLLGVGGMCMPERAIVRGAGVEVERFCNAFAGAFLVPAQSLLGDKTAASRADAGTPASDRDLESLASKFRVSRPVMWYRLHETGLISDDAFKEKWREWERQWQSVQAHRRTAGGPALPTAEKRLLQYGVNFVSRVVAAEERGDISSSEALEYLSIRLKDLPEMSSLVGAA